MATLSYRDQSTERSMSILDERVTLPTKFSEKGALSNILKKPSTEQDELPAENLIDLRFLTNDERCTLERVIRKDLQLRRTMLGSLKKSVDDGQKFVREHQSSETKNLPSSCGNCKQPIRTICGIMICFKCSECRNSVCKNCEGKKQDRSSSPLCSTCLKQRLLKLQSLDYEYLYNYGHPDTSIATKETRFPNIAESELIKKSLEEQRKSAVDKGVVQNLSMSLTVLRAEEREERSASVPCIQSLFSINDPNSGFKLIAKASEESLIDLCSVYSEQCYFDVKITGRILIGVWYRADDRRLYVRCVRAENLAAPVDGSLDPYVKTYLLPGVFKSNKRKTGIQNNTIEPSWDEILKYRDLSQEDLSLQTLWVSVWDWSRYGRQQFLGEVHIPLSKCDHTDPKDQWYTLQESSEATTLPDSKGRVLLGLKFKPYSNNTVPGLADSAGMGCLHILIKQAENLPAMDLNDRTDGFVRCYLLPNRMIGGKKKSSVVKNSLNPVWYDEVIYTYLSVAELEDSRALEVTVWDFDRRGSNQFIGGIRLGPNPLDLIDPSDWMDSSESETTHWEDMLSKPGEWVEAWHTLRPSMDSQNQLKKDAEDNFSDVSLEPPVNVATVSTTGYPQKKALTLPPSTQPPTDKSLTVNISRQAKGKYKINGEVLIGLKYSNGRLFVNILKALGLTAVNKDRTSNPYIKIYLLPDRSKSSKMKTLIKKRTLEPVFNETFKYKVKKQDLVNRTLWVTVWNSGSVKSKSFLGETCIAMGGASLRHMSERWYELHDFVETGVIMATPVGCTPCQYTYLLAESNAATSQTTPKQLVSDEHIPLQQLAPDEDTPPQQLVSDEHIPLQQRAPDEDTPPQQLTPDEDTPSQQLTPDEDTPSQQLTPDEDKPIPLKVVQTEEDSESKQIPIVVTTAENIDLNFDVTFYH